MAVPDFEKQWLARLSRRLVELAGMEIRDEVMKGSEHLSDNSDQREIIYWSVQALQKLDALLDDGKKREILTGCACKYPKSDLQEIREKYAETGDIDRVHTMLQEKFRSFLKNRLKIDDGLIRDVVDRGWGLAGVKKGNTIIATKIPKSGNLVEYMKETDKVKKRALYCHCPRVREAVIMPQVRLSSTYCYCGAGFYKGIWEEILQRSVSVEVLKTVMKGDDVCQIAIHLD